ncbi:hypothetical protein BDP55DRAFT_304427 [Colletotrichum godetiae]|uniref:Uncharacterized protein n=1 Tax=Colletotrichum godetiae TaxID=1209918 RepID=A0AAJ0AUQ7_9PEZI|nr:uncharacterized protein BDP55DRAFT_304427 [Colletotrichum godetiae]KAK1690726.1 hypothetical protein BDP55DRAFT_304427 [Colletotrichum godetiae]
MALVVTGSWCIWRGKRPVSRKPPTKVLTALTFRFALRRGVFAPLRPEDVRPGRWLLPQAISTDQKVCMCEPSIGCQISLDFRLRAFGQFETIQRRCKIIPEVPSSNHEAVTDFLHSSMAPALRMTRSIKEKLPIFLSFFL